LANLVDWVLKASCSYHRMQQRFSSQKMADLSGFRWLDSPLSTHYLKGFVSTLSNLFIMAEQESEDDYSLTVNLRRLYQLQLAVNISDNHLFTDLQGILNDYSNLEDEVI
jgi:hypothetical protein